MTTPLEPTFRKLVNDSVEQLLKQQVTPWAFFAAGLFTRAWSTLTDA